MWKKESFAYAAIFGYMGEVRTSVHSVIPFRSKDYPMGVAAPRMVRVRISSIGLFHFVNPPGGKFQHPEVSFGMPDGEGTIVRYGKQQVLAVRRAFGETDGFFFG